MIDQKHRIRQMFPLAISIDFCKDMLQLSSLDTYNEGMNIADQTSAVDRGSGWGLPSLSSCLLISEGYQVMPPSSDHNTSC